MPKVWVTPWALSFVAAGPVPSDMRYLWRAVTSGPVSQSSRSVVNAYGERAMVVVVFPACASSTWSSARSVFSSAWREEVAIAVEGVVEVETRSGEEKAVDD